VTRDDPGAGRERSGRLHLPMTAPSRTRDLAWLALLSMAAAAAALSSRSRRAGPEVEAVPAALVSMHSLAPEPAPLPSSPRPRETQDAVWRVFGDAVAADTGRAVAGDFNGDGAPDLAVVVRPATGALNRINHELANWTLQDAVEPLDPTRRRPPRVIVAEGDVLLAVIHGYATGGWRNRQARQSYLVRNACHARPRVVQDGRGLARAGPKLVGAVIVDDGASDRPGFLYWSGARYVWFTSPLASAGR